MDDQFGFIDDDPIDNELKDFLFRLQRGLLQHITNTCTKPVEPIEESELLLAIGPESSDFIQSLAKKLAVRRDSFATFFQLIERDDVCLVRVNEPLRFSIHCVEFALNTQAFFFVVNVHSRITSTFLVLLLK